MNHRMLVLSEKCRKGETFSLGFYAYVNSRDRSSFFRLYSAVPSFAVMSLYFDMKNIYEAAMLLDEGDEERIAAFAVLEDAVNALDTRRPDLLSASVPWPLSTSNRY